MQSAACVARLAAKKNLAKKFGLASAFQAGRLQAFYLWRWQVPVWKLVRATQLTLTLMLTLKLKLAASHL